MKLSVKIKKALAKWLFPYLMELLPKPDKFCLPDIPSPRIPKIEEHNIIQLRSEIYLSDYDYAIGR